jgi:GNAT superfamily N-acetyltransferase
VPLGQAAHLAWKLEGQPGLPTFAQVVEIDGRIVSLALAVQARCLVRGEPSLIEIGGDAATLPEYQGRGLYTLRRTFQRGNVARWLDFSMEYSRNPTVIRRRARIEARPFRNAPRVLVRVLDARRLGTERRSLRGHPLPRWLGTAALGAAQVAPAVLALPRLAVPGRWRPGVPHHARRDPAPALTLSSAPRFDDRADALFSAAAGSFDFIKARDAAYLNWRYCDRRAGDFRALIAEEADRLVGYTIVRPAGERGYIADLLALPGRHDVVRALLDRSTQTLREAGAAAVFCWLPGRHPYRSLFRSRGFFDSRSPTGVACEFYRVAPDRLTPVLDDPSARVHLTMGDLDAV